jgi:hypothetical protein
MLNTNKIEMVCVDNSEMCEHYWIYSCGVMEAGTHGKRLVCGMQKIRIDKDFAGLSTKELVMRMFGF